MDLKFLTGRTFQVRTGEILSTIRLIFAGVPQGSVLGPILFIIYFIYYLDPGLHFHIHAETMATRALKRINMLRSIKGHNWGASEELIINSYKVLIRPIMEYAPIATLIMSDKNKNKIEKVQRAAVRVATYWPIKTSTATMYAKFNLKSAVERAQELADNYMVKSIANNELIQSTAH